MQRRKRYTWPGTIVALVVIAGCSDDDGAGDSTEPSVESTAPEITESPPDTTATPPTGPPTTTTTSTTVAPSTTVSDEELKAQIAADYQRSWQLRLALVANPTLDGLDAKLAEISAPGSESEATLQAFVSELVSLGERVVPGAPDEFRIDVEGVELVGAAPYQEAVLTMCFVSNTVRIDSAGGVVSDFGIIASRSDAHVVRTAEGWLPDTGMVDYWQGLEVTECPPA